MASDTKQDLGEIRSNLPFEGLRVLDLSQGIAGPYCAHILRQQGASVTKIDPPTGDWGRGIGVVRGDLSSLAIAFNGGKHSLCLDAMTAEGQQVLRLLASQADVIVENFRPGVVKRLGLDPKELLASRPELIVASISGYGQDGPYAFAPATDSVVQADAGLMFCNRNAASVPQKIGVYLADVNAGLFAAQAVSAALYRRLRLGVGEHVEISLFDTCAATMVCNFAEHAMEPARQATATIPISAPNGTFQASDGAINVVTVNNDQFARACAAIASQELLSDPRFADGPSRVVHAQHLNAHFAEKIAAAPVAHWLAQFKSHDVLHAPIHNYSQCIDHPQAVHAGTFEKLDQPTVGELRLPATPARKLRRSVETAPHIGEHSTQLLRKAGARECDIEEWLASGVVMQHRTA